MEKKRFQQIILLLRRNDPIINSLNMSSIKLTDEMTSDLISAFQENQFISKIVLQKNELSATSIRKIFNLLSTNPKITYFEINNNSIDDDSIQFLSNILKGMPPNREPISLILRQNTFGPTGAKYLASALEANAPIHYLDLRENSGIKDKGIEDIALSLSNNTILTGIDLIKCGCDQLGADALARALMSNHTMLTLLLQDPLSNGAIDSLGSLLSDPKCSLQTLYLWKCQLNQESLELLCRSLRSNTSLQTLALSYNFINDNAAIYISDMIYRNKSLTKLQLGANRFNPPSAGFFGVALAKNDTLKFLDLSRNSLRSVGVWPLAVALLNNKTLETLDLRYNMIDPEGINFFCELISGNSAINVLKLSGNNFNDESISLLAKKLARNTTIKEIELNEVGMTSVSFAALCNALQMNNTLQRISLNKNNLTANALAAFANLLKVNTSLLFVGMSECEIDDCGAMYIAEGITSNSSLNELDLSKNRIFVDGIRAISDAVMGNYSLMKINLKNNPFISVEQSNYNDCHYNGDIADFLERNNYYLHNLLMKDMGELAKEKCFYT